MNWKFAADRAAQPTMNMFLGLDVGPRPAPARHDRGFDDIKAASRPKARIVCYDCPEWIFSEKCAVCSVLIDVQNHGAAGRHSFPTNWTPDAFGSHLIRFHGEKSATASAQIFAKSQVVLNIRHLFRKFVCPADFNKNTYCKYVLSWLEHNFKST